MRFETLWVFIKRLKRLSTGMCESFSLLHTFCTSPHNTNGRYMHIVPQPSLLAFENRDHNTLNRTHQSPLKYYYIVVHAFLISPVVDFSHKIREIVRNKPNPLSLVVFAQDCGAWVKIGNCRLKKNIQF